MNTENTTMNRSRRSRQSTNGNNMSQDQQNQLLKISLKKQIDRKQKLEKLLQKYEQISTLEKDYVKVIKSHIIELKDTPDIIKEKFHADPYIYVNNELSTEIRIFLCKMLNTFYKIYSQNERCEKQSNQVAHTISQTINEVAFTEQMLFKYQKENIVQQVQIQGQHLRKKSTLKEQSQKLKEAQQQYSKIFELYSESKNKFEQQNKVLDNLKEEIEKAKQDSLILEKQTNLSKSVQRDNQQKIAGQLVYRYKIEQEMAEIDNNIKEQIKRQKMLTKKLLQKKVSLCTRKGMQVSEHFKHNLTISYLQQRSQNIKTS